MLILLIYFGYMNDMNVTFLDTIRPTGDHSENHGDLLGTFQPKTAV